VQQILYIITYCLQTAESGAWRDVRERKPSFQITDSVYESVQIAAYNSRAVYLEARERVNSYFQDAPLRCQLTKVPDDILRLPGRFIFQRNSPYKAAIDQQ
jgi:hypothetical protein